MEKLLELVQQLPADDQVRVREYAQRLVPRLVPPEYVYRGVPTKAWFTKAIESLGGKVRAADNVARLQVVFFELGGRWRVGGVLAEELGRGGCGVVRAISETVAEKQALPVRSRTLAKRLDELIVREYHLMMDLSINRKLDYVPSLVVDSLRENPSRFMMERLARPLQAIPNGDEIIQIFDIMVSMHRLGLVIVDLKPSNFMHSSSGALKMVDYGLVETYLTSSSSSRSRTQRHRAERKVSNGGTPYYMSIRVMENDTLVSRRDDLESFVYLWEELVVGYLPWNKCKDSAIVSMKRKFVPTSENRKQFLTIVKGLRYGEEPPYTQLRDLVK